MRGYLNRLCGCWRRAVIGRKKTAMLGTIRQAIGIRRLHRSYRRFAIASCRRSCQSRCTVLQLLVGRKP